MTSPPRRGVPAEHLPDPERTAILRRADLLVVAAIVAVGVGLRFVSTSALWLDEALSVNIASLPPGQIVEALRQDGHPPLYYLLLHGWMEVFGDGDVAVRSLSALFGVLTLPVVWVLAQRRGGRDAALAAVAVVAVLPFAVRYSTEARMYSLVIALVAVGWLLLDRLHERARPTDAVLLAVTVAALLYTHYWSVWILGTVGVALAWSALRGRDPHLRAGSRLAVGSLVAGGVAFLPWVPVLLDQLARTGTPWAVATRPTAGLVITAVDLVGQPVVVDALLGGLLLAVLVLLGLTGLPSDSHHVSIDLRTRPPVRRELAVAVGALLVGLTLSWLVGSAFASRYAAIIVPVVVVAAGVGITALPTRVHRLAMIGATTVLLGTVSLAGTVDQRTQGRDAATAISGAGTTGDLVVVCPDQLGPALSRSLSIDVELVGYPSLTPAERVDWRDYAERNEAADPSVVADELLADATGRDIWLVWMSGYQTFGSDCEALAGALGSERERILVTVADPEVFEPMWVERFTTP
ncbi:MAG: glycosyltransferase family 39 protein [Acidimicrobiales bacterium]